MMIIAYLNAIEFIEEELLHSSIFSDTHTYRRMFVCVYILLFIFYLCILLGHFFRVKTLKTLFFLLIVRAPFKIELNF